MPATPPPTPDDAQPKDVPKSAGERIGGAIGGVLAAGGGREASESPLVQAMQKHHQQRIDLAQKHYKDFQTYTGILATGNDPDTGQPLTPEKKSKYETLRDAANAELEKTAGVNKDVKGKLQKLRLLADHIIKLHPKTGAQGAEGGGQETGAGGGGRPTPPPSPTSATDSLKQNADLPRLRQEMEDQRAFNTSKKMEEVKRDMKIAEEKAKAEQPGSARAYEGHPWSVQDAKAASEQGQEFLDQQGEPIDIAKVPEDQVLYPVYLSKGKMYWRLGSSSKVNTTFDNIVHRGSRFDASGGAEKGAARVPTTSASESGIDPVTGTTKTQRTTTPITGGKTRTSAPPSPGGARGTGGAPLLPTAQTAKRIAPVREAMTQVLGDPTQPDFKSLGSYAKLADDPIVTKHVGEALQYVLNGMEQEEKRAGSLMTLLENYGGIPQSLVRTQVEIHKEMIGKLTPREAELFNASISSLSTFVGMRSLTGGSAAQFSVKALERDLPLVGFNVFDSKAFSSKMGRAAESVYTGSRTVPLTPAERKHIEESVKKWNAAPQGKARTTPPPKPGPKSIDDEIMEAVGAAKRKP